MKKITSESGQALILIVFAIIGLIGMTGLTVDGGMAYSDRRNAQNAADTAALAAARAKIRAEDWQAAGYSLASSNGYNNNGTTNTVEVVTPPIVGIYANCSSTTFNCNDYIQVIITSNINTTFARVVGINQMTNKVNAVAKVIPTTRESMFDGNAIVGLNPHGCKSVQYQGNAGTTIHDGNGIFVNSDCDDTTGAFFSQSGSANLDAPGLCSVGEINNNGAFSGTAIEGCKPYDYPVTKYVMPKPECAGEATQNGNILSAGTVSGNFPPTGVTQLLPGVYCVEGDFRMNGSDTLTGSNVIIYMINGDVSWQGGTINLSAPTEGPYEDLLIYMPYDSSGDVTVNGNVYQYLTGTILAPAADVQINGTQDSEIHGQVIGYNISIEGGSGIDIYYDEDENYQAETPPYLQLTE